jgi:hypothetical protein
LWLFHFHSFVSDVVVTICDVLYESMINVNTVMF